MSTQARPTRYTLGALTISPALALAPMEGVTNVVFRRLVRRLGGVGLTYTEFMPSKEIVLSRGTLEQLADIDPRERPLAIQLFGRDPALMAQAAAMLQERGAQLIDLNMGCPAKNVCQNSGGSALLRDPELAVQIVRQVRRAIDLPLTVKMRSGYDPSLRNAPELALRFEDEGVQGITIHWRTREDGYGGQRDVSAIARAVERLSIPVVGNGDIVDVASAQAMLDETGCAGLMIGRGAIQNPWIFTQLAAWMQGEPVPWISPAQRMEAIEAYAQDLTQTFGSPRAALGRVKMMIRHAGESLPQGEQLKQQACRQPTLPQALEAARAYFQALEASSDMDLSPKGAP